MAIGSLAPMTDLAAGTEIAGYRVEGILGRGGMGVVYRAADERLGRSVAVKVIAPEQARDPAFQRRFSEESRSAAAIDHPNVLPVYEAGEQDGLLFLATRLVDGDDLAELIRAEDAFGPERAVGLVEQVAAALDAAHGSGLVHRDVKPANVLVTGIPGRGGGEHCYLTDFGLAKQDDAQTGLTATGQFVGTLDYIAPEQVQGEKLDGRADQYALAAMLFQLLVGAPPFSRDSSPALIWAHMNDPPPSVSEYRPGLPRELDAVIARGMAKRPDERFGSCAALAAAARAALAGTAPEPITAAPAETIAAPAERASPPAAGVAAEPPRRHRRPLALAGIAALLAVAAGAWVLLGSDSGSAEPTRLAVGDERWTASTGDAILSTPAVSGATLIIGSDDRTVYAFDAGDGKELWTAPTDGPVRSSPLLAGGTAYVGSFDGNLYALAARNGREQWIAPTGFEVFSSPALSGETVVVGAEGVLAIDSDSGAEQWRFDTGGAVNSSPAIEDGTAYVGADDGSLHALALGSGRERWSTELDGDPVNSSPAVAEGTAYVGADDGLHAVDAESGDQNWQLDVPGGINSSPAVSEGTVFVGTRDGSVLAVDAASGEQVWRFEAGDAVDSSPAISGGVVYVGANDGIVYGLDAESGEERWRFDAGEAVVASPVLAGGLVYVATDGGDIYAVEGSER